MQCDLSKQDEILSMFGEIEKRHGGLDICVNNAGMSKYGSIIDGSPQEWMDMINVSYIGVVYMLVVVDIYVSSIKSLLLVLVYFVCILYPIA